MERSRKNRKKWIWLAAVPAALIVLAAAALLLVGGAGLSARYDDAEAILAAYDSSPAPSLSAGEDGSVRLRLTREDVYWYARKYGLLDAVRAELDAAGVSAGGFRIAGGQLTGYARCRTLGLLPLSYKAALEVRWEDALVVSAGSVTLGRSISLPRSRWPEVFRKDFVIPADDLTPLLTDAYIEDDALVLVHAGLRSFSPDTLPADRALLTALQLFGLQPEDPDGIAAFLFSLSGEDIPMGEAREIYYAAEAPLTAMARLLSYADPEVLPTLWSEADPFTREMLVDPLLREASKLRSAMEDKLSAEQTLYEKLLSAVRESYKSGGLAIAESGFVSVSTGQPLDPGAMTALPIAATDCRVVFLRSGYGGAAICTGDMPPVSQISRSGKKVMDGLLDESAVYDLGVALTTGADTPVLIYRRNDGALMFREIGEAVFVSLLMERSNPIVDVDALPAPARSCSRSAGEGWSGAVLLTLAPSQAQ